MENEILSKNRLFLYSDGHVELGNEKINVVNNFDENDECTKSSSINNETKSDILIPHIRGCDLNSEFPLMPSLSERSRIFRLEVYKLYNDVMICYIECS